MKKQILIIGALSIFSFTRAQDIPASEVPSLVLNKFNSEFPKGADVEWEMERNLYKVEFETGRNIDHTIWYDAEGKIQKSKKDISSKELPKAVKKRIQIDFRSYTLDDIESIKENDKTIYKIDLNSLFNKDRDIVIDTDGNVLSNIVD